MNKRFRTYLQHPKMRVALTVLSLLSIVAGVAMAGAAPQSADASNVMNVVKNGSFEGGFTSQPGCGMVGTGWSCFTNGGAAGYGFYDDMWEPVVADGAHSQLIEVNTKGLVTADADRYVGIYQTVKVKPGEVYKLSLKGMIRTTELEGDPWRYRVEVGYTHGMNADWQHVMNWQDVGWDEYFPRTEPGNFDGFMGQIKAKDEALTLYIRVWKKWGVPNQELDVNLDSISLVGMMHGMGEKPMAMPMPETKPAGQTEKPMAMPDKSMAEKPMQKSMSEAKPVEQMVCNGYNVVYNESFEHGFNPASIGEVGKAWGSFTNGGAANYGFYDDMWESVVASGKHAQLIEINTNGIDVPDDDRYAGIYQRISKLEPGKTYELTVRGVLRGEGGEDGDPNRWEAQVGVNWNADTNWEHVSNWQGMDLGGIQSRTEPESIGAYKTRFTAQNSTVVIFLRGWFKWGQSNLEMDLNFDDVTLVDCEKQLVWPDKPMMAEGPMSNSMLAMSSMDGAPMMQDAPMSGPPAGMKPTAEPPAAEAPAPPATTETPDHCTYVIKPGDSMSVIAERLGTTVDALSAANGITNPSIIYVGQELSIPGCEMSIAPINLEPITEMVAGLAPMAQPPVMAPMQINTVHRVQPGETLTDIAAHFGVNLGELTEINGLANASFLYVGQQLRMP